MFSLLDSVILFILIASDKGAVSMTGVYELCLFIFYFHLDAVAGFYLIMIGDSLCWPDLRESNLLLLIRDLHENGVFYVFYPMVI